MHRAPATVPLGALLVLVVSLLVLVATPVAVAVRDRRDPVPSTVGSTVAALADQQAPSASSALRDRPAPPAALVIPAIGVSTSVVAAGVDASGGVAVPADIKLVGWYRFGARPGDPAGSAVIVGHRDGRLTGTGALFDLGRLTVGDTVVVVDSDWQRHEFTVVGRQAFNKKAVPYAALFATGGRPRLTLISCGGRFLKDRGSYEDNIVVTAVPVGRAAKEQA